MKVQFPFPLPLIGHTHLGGAYCPFWWLIDAVVRDARAKYGPDSMHGRAIAAAADAWWEKNMRKQPEI